MRKVDFRLYIGEKKHGRLLDSIVEKRDGNPGRERSIKAVYDSVMETTRAGVSFGMVTHPGSSLSLLDRLDADLGKFQPLLEHKSLKKTAIDDRIKDNHPFILELQDPRYGWEWVSQLMLIYDN